MTLLIGKESLSNSTVDQKWDRVKVICTQPYNKANRPQNELVHMHFDLVVHQCVEYKVWIGVCSTTWAIR